LNLKNKEIRKIDNNPSVLKQIVVPDTSVIVQGIISKELKADSLKFKKIIIHEAVMAELESQANKGRETGYLGLDEITRIRDLSFEKDFQIEFLGSRPGDFEIKFAKSGEIDSLIRDFAGKEDATLLTADIVQGKVAIAKGLSVIIYDVPSDIKESLLLEDFFVDGAMSIHLRENCVPKAKVGKPGSWKYVETDKEPLSKERLEMMSYELIEFAKTNDESFFESDKKFSTVIQIKNMRIVIVRPPLSDAFEITAVRPISRLSLDDYDIDDSLKKRLLGKAEGLLVAGPPGHGKSTFVQCLADKYSSLNKVVKTLESPRDLVVDKSITRYGASQAQNSEIRDVLLLSRPDFVLFDEVRNPDDFRLFSDLRLSGIGMLGVLHAAEPIDAVQRFIGKLDLGVIPHVLDTVIFVMNGRVEKVFSLKLGVKVPSGMVESDLARPVIMINDFFTGRLEFEVYSYGEEAIVVPISSEFKKPMHALAEKQLLEEVKKLGVDDAKIEFVSDNKCIIHVPKDSVPKIIGPKGIIISELEKKIKIKLDVLEKKASKNNSDDDKELVDFSCIKNAKHVIFDLDSKAQDKLVSLFVEDDFVMSVKASKKNQIKVTLDSPNGKTLSKAYDDKKQIRIFLA
jgi:ATPase